MHFKISLKQLDSIKESDARFNFWVGSVRSGKTFASLVRFDDFVKKGPEGDYAIIGKSRDTIKRNILGPLRDMLGNRFTYSIGKSEATLYGKTIHLIGANDERSEHKIRGLTLAGCYVDEMTIIPECVWKMLGTRLSVSGAKLFGTTNPDSPFHWLKRDYIDRAEELDLKVFHFKIDDNPSLDPKYVDALKREYKGLWYRRYIEGEWALAEGTIFDFFDKELHVIDFPPSAADYYVVGVDYGTTNPCVFSMIGYRENVKPSKWLEKIWYFDSAKAGYQMTDAQYFDAFQRFTAGYQVRATYVDPSAASFKLELIRGDVLNVIEAKNDVLDGIRYHSTLLSTGDFKVCSNCRQAIDEYGQYVWDTKAAARGEERPLKQHDHVLDSIRYALYSEWYSKQGRRMTVDDIEQIKDSVYGRPAKLGKFFDETVW